MPKYNNKKTSCGNMTFDSKKEAARFPVLMMEQAAGLIRNLKLQPSFTIQESFKTPAGETIRSVVYKADFQYDRKTLPDINGDTYWVNVVEDVKGMKTPVYLLKYKLLAEKGIKITEI